MTVYEANLEALRELGLVNAEFERQAATPEFQLGASAAKSNHLTPEQVVEHKAALKALVHLVASRPDRIEESMNLLKSIMDKEKSTN